MGRVLGLDLGTNSLGWAVIDGATCDIFDRGVVVFPEGVNADDKLETPAAIRRNARAARRLKFRRRWRKWQLLEILIANGMCPMTADELKAWRERGEYPVGNRDFIEWLKSSDVRNPYADRAAAVSGKVDPFVLGRALYHIVQRRGFKSSRKDAPDTAEGAGEKKASNKTTGAVKGGIAELTEEIERAGCRTLGEYFAKIIRDNASLRRKIRVRKRYTGRNEHYLKEFELICDVQGLDAKLREDLRKAIFHQRPLRSQKHLAGKCPLEPRSPRARTAHPLFEEFRLRSFINNLSLEKKPSPGEPEFARGETIPLSRDEKTRIYDYLTSVEPEIAANGKKRGKGKKRVWTIGAIEEAIAERLERESLRFHYYEAADALPAAPTSALLRECFGRNLSEADAVKVFDALSFYDDNGKLSQWFAKHYPELDAGKIKKLCSCRVEEGYAKYSLKAIKKILRFLRKGYDAYTARVAAVLPEIVEGFDGCEEQVMLRFAELQELARAERDRWFAAGSIPGCRPPEFMERFRDYLLDKFGILLEKSARLYWSSGDPYDAGGIEETENGESEEKWRLPAVSLGMIRNPVAQRAMTVLRRLVNTLRRNGTIDGGTEIHIELARNVNSHSMRKAIQGWQKNSRRNAPRRAKNLQSSAFPSRKTSWTATFSPTSRIGNAFTLAGRLAYLTLSKAPDSTSSTPSPVRARATIPWQTRRFATPNTTVKSRKGAYLRIAPTTTSRRRDSPA